MIQKAIIEQATSPTTYRVRIPEVDGVYGYVYSTPTSELPIATVVSPPNMVPNYIEGDVVYVAYERGEDPVIIGKLLSPKPDNTFANINLQNVEIHGEILVGNTTRQDILNLSGTTGNIQEQINNISANVEAIAISGGGGGGGGSGAEVPINADTGTFTQAQLDILNEGTSNYISYGDKIFKLKLKSHPIRKYFTQTSDPNLIELVNVNMATGDWRYETIGNTVLTNHINDSVVHITSTERTDWNNRIRGDSYVDSNENLNLITDLTSLGG